MTDREYLAALDSMFGGPDETEIRCRTTKLVVTRSEQYCQCPFRLHSQHTIKKGVRCVVDRAIADGQWSRCYVCLPCLESWHNHCLNGSDWCSEAPS